MNKNDTDPEEETLRFFATAPRPCSYLEGRDAISVFADPDATLSTALYDQLAKFGFRRSGSSLYVPACPGCSECIPVRVSVAGFVRSRNQQKIWNRNRDLTCNTLTPEFREQHFEMYERYLGNRHPHGGMDNPEPDDYMRFMTSDWCDTLFVEFCLGETPVALAVTDRLHNAASAVYTFYEPELGRRSLGTYAVLRQIELAKEMGCDWLYLGYWIRGSKKMQYKSRFRPMQAYYEGHWQPIENIPPKNPTPIRHVGAVS
ncbi:MAG TPA: arginyltransferase [Gammaproteobacteria bacterium]|nr:arginyltransferase [Gammaproteobacteria bacterium]